MSKKIIKLTDKDLESIIEKVITEQHIPGLRAVAKAHKITKKENAEYHKSVGKKMEAVLKTNNESDTIESKDLKKVNADQGMGEEQKDIIQDYNYALQNLRYDTQPSKAYKERQEMAIKGHSKMGNANTEATEMTEDLKDKLLGEKIIAAAKARYKAEAASPYNNIISMGDDIELAKESPNKVRKLAFENIVGTIKEKLLKEGIELSNEEIADSLKEEIGGFGYGFKQEAEETNEEVVEEGIDTLTWEEIKAGAKKITDKFGITDEIKQLVVDPISGVVDVVERIYDLLDTSDLSEEQKESMSELLSIIQTGETPSSQEIQEFGDTTNSIITQSPIPGMEIPGEELDEESEVLSEKGKCPHMYCEDSDGSCQPCKNIGQDPGIKLRPEPKAYTDQSPVRGSRMRRRGESVDNVAESKKYKRLKYSKEFESAEQALTLIPEHHKVNGNTFQLTDNNNYITVRWDGNKESGEGVVLLHKNVKKMNESIDRMKKLINHSFGDKEHKKDNLTEEQSFQRIMDVTRGKKKVIDEQFSGFGFVQPSESEVIEEQELSLSPFVGDQLHADVITNLYGLIGKNESSKIGDIFRGLHSIDTLDCANLDDKLSSIKDKYTTDQVVAYQEKLSKAADVKTYIGCEDKESHPFVDGDLGSATIKTLAKFLYAYYEYFIKVKRKGKDVADDLFSNIEGGGSGEAVPSDYTHDIGVDGAVQR